MGIRRQLQKPKREMMASWIREAAEVKVIKSILENKISKIWGMIRYGGNKGRDVNDMLVS